MEQFQLEYNIFESLVRTLVFLSANDIIDRENKQNIDTFLLKEALEIRERSFRTAFFWTMYESVAKRFDESFTDVNFTCLPFGDDSLSLPKFLTQIWKSFFVCEIESVIREHPDFAIIVIKAVVSENEGWQCGCLLEEIIAKRYGTTENKDLASMTNENSVKETRSNETNSEDANQINIKMDDNNNLAKVYIIDFTKEIEKCFDDSSIPEDGIPKFVVLAGGVCAGKTTIRKQKYSKGYVVVDAGEIFISLSNGEYFEFGEAFEEPLEIIGRSIVSRAIKEKRNIVTEIIGADAENNEMLVNAITSLGYQGEIIAVHCDMEEAWERNINRDEDNISAHFTEPYHLRWILEVMEKINS